MKTQLRNTQLRGIFTTVTPSFPEFATDLPADMDDWGCDQLKAYYLRVKAAKGKTIAKDSWFVDTEKLGFWADAQLCRYNCQWVRWAEKEGLTTGSNIFSNIFCAGEAVTEGVETGAQLLKPVLIAGAVAGLIFVFRQANK